MKRRLNPETAHNIFDKNSRLYICPTCNEPLERNQDKCRWCGQPLKWDKEGEKE